MAGLAEPGAETRDAPVARMPVLTRPAKWSVPISSVRPGAALDQSRLIRGA